MIAKSGNDDWVGAYHADTIALPAATAKCPLIAIYVIDVKQQDKSL